MKVLILIAHADPNSTTSSHKLAKAAEEALLEDHHEVKVVDLVKEGFDRVATKDDFVKFNHPERFNYINECADASNLTQIVRDQQELVRWSTHIIVVGPIWYLRYPATFYAWFERVFTMNFSFRFDEKGNKITTLDGRKVLLAVTTGDGAEYYSVEGSHTTMENILYTTSVGHFGYCRFTLLRSQIFYQFAELSPEKQQEIINKWKLAVKNIDNRPLLPFNGDKREPGSKNDGEILSVLPDLTLEEAIAAK